MIQHLLNGRPAIYCQPNFENAPYWVVSSKSFTHFTVPASFTPSEFSSMLDVNIGGELKEGNGIFLNLSDGVVFACHAVPFYDRLATAKYAIDEQNTFVFDNGTGLGISPPNFTPQTAGTMTQRRAYYNQVVREFATKF